jgi:hypothetical protein
MAGIANILLNLPQVLDQTRVGPSRGHDSEPAGPDSGRAHRKHHAQDNRSDEDSNDKH